MMAASILLVAGLVYNLSEEGNQKITLFAGNSVTAGTAKKISAFPSIAVNYTLISSNDFLCQEEAGCELLPQNYTLNVSGRSVTYQEALVALNLIQKPFSERVKIFYLAVDAYNIGSVVGLRRGSAFLDYLYDQDTKAGFRVRFLIDARNNFRFLDEVDEAKLRKAEYEKSTTISFPASAMLDGQSLRFCLSNAADRTSTPAYFFVPHDSLALWQAEILGALQAGKSAAKGSQLTFSTSSSPSDHSGEIRLEASDLIQEGNVLVGSFDSAFDQQRACDIYTGSLLLSKYNFCLYYIEYDEAYEVKFSFDPLPSTNSSQSEEGFPEERKAGLWWKVAIFSLIIGVVGYLCYFFIHREVTPTEVYRQQPAGDQDYEMDMLSAQKTPNSREESKQK